MTGTPQDDSIPKLPIRRRCRLDHPVKIQGLRARDIIEYAVKCNVWPEHEWGPWEPTPEAAVAAWENC